MRNKMWTGINQYSIFMCLQFKNKYSALYVCKKGGFILTRHNNLRHLTAHLLTNICNDVEVEPRLLSVAEKNLETKRQPEVTRPGLI